MYHGTRVEVYHGTRVEVYHNDVALKVHSHLRFIVDPVRLFLSLSLGSVFRGKTTADWNGMADPVCVIVRGGQPHYSLFWLVPNNKKWSRPHPITNMHSSRKHITQLLAICLLRGGCIHPEGCASMVMGCINAGEVHPSEGCIPSGCTLNPHGQLIAYKCIIFPQLHLHVVTITNFAGHCRKAIAGGFRRNTGPKLKLKYS